MIVMLLYYSISYTPDEIEARLNGSLVDGLLRLHQYAA